MKSLDTLRRVIKTAPEMLLQISTKTAAKPSARQKWSRKQELGHLVDSAANNHQRIVRAQLEAQPAMPGYDGDRWVDLHAYQGRDWKELVGIWSALNQQLLAAAKGASPSGLRRTCTIAGSEPLSVKFIVDDYVEHMLHHLQHIGLKLEQLTIKDK